MTGYISSTHSICLFRRAIMLYINNTSVTIETVIKQRKSPAEILIAREKICISFYCSTYIGKLSR